MKIEKYQYLSLLSKYKNDSKSTKDVLIISLRTCTLHQIEYDIASYTLVGIIASVSFTIISSCLPSLLTTTMINSFIFGILVGFIGCLYYLANKKQQKDKKLNGGAAVKGKIII